MLRIIVTEKKKKEKTKKPKAYLEETWKIPIYTQIENSILVKTRVYSQNIMFHEIK